MYWGEVEIKTEFSIISYQKDIATQVYLITIINQYIESAMYHVTIILFYTVSYKN